MRELWLRQPRGGRFCNQCGDPIEGPPARTAERRQVTVVFSDLSGFTAMSENLDPEDVQEVMGEIFARATEIVERYSGRVDKLLGDAVMSVFGDPVAHEDDAERAIRATLEIHAAVDELSPRFEPQIGTALKMQTVRAAVAYLRDIVASGVQMPAPLFIDVGEALVMMGDGDLSEGMASLERTIELASETSRDWEWLFGRSVKTVFLARIATGELAGDWKALLRNPRFVPYFRRARSSVGVELSAVRDDAHARGLEVIANVCDLEQAKLLVSQGETDEARRLLERSLAFFDRSAETEGPRRVEELLAKI